MIFNQIAIKTLGLVKPFIGTKRKLHGVSHGLSEAGYDVRVAETVRFHNFLFGLIRWTSVHDARTNTVVRRWGNFALASTIEEFNLPTNIVGIAHDKSTHIRSGLMIGNTVLEPGWKGFLTLELFFNGKSRTIPSGSGISQIIFHETLHGASYSGKYQNQAAQAVEAIFEDK